LALRTYNPPPETKAEESVEDDTFPDIGSMNDEELKELIDNLTAEEQEVSYRRREALIKGDDVQRLSEILAGRVLPPTMPPT
jgi:hypothetical protein